MLEPGETHLQLCTVIKKFKEKQFYPPSLLVPQLHNFQCSDWLPQTYTWDVPSETLLRNSKLKNAYVST